MRLLLFLHNLWSISSTARLARDLAKALSSKGVEVEFLLSRRIPDELDDVPFPIYTLNKKGEIGRAFGIREFLQKRHYDVVLSYMRSQNVSLSMAKSISPCPRTLFIGSVHYADNYKKVNSPLYLPYRLLMKKIYENLDGIIAVSSVVKEDLKKAFFIKDKKIKVIHNYIDVKRVKELSRESLSAEEESFFKRPVIVNVGRVEPEKGHKELIRTFLRIKKQLPEAGLAILGDGSLMGEVRELVKRFGLSNDVFMPGFVRNPFKYVARSKVFIFPSFREGVGNVVLEAQALGIPVVAFKSHGGHVEVLRSSALFAPAGDVATLAKHTLALLKDQKLREKFISLGKENVKHYTAQRKAEEYLSYFNELMN